LCFSLAVWLVSVKSNHTGFRRTQTHTRSLPPPPLRPLQIKVVLFAPSHQIFYPNVVGFFFFLCGIAHVAVLQTSGFQKSSFFSLPKPPGRRSLGMRRVPSIFVYIPEPKVDVPNFFFGYFPLARFLFPPLLFARVPDSLFF